jgi:hypothetical protein
MDASWGISGGDQVLDVPGPDRKHRGIRNEPGVMKGGPAAGALTPLLPPSESGRLLVEPESTLPVGCRQRLDYFERGCASDRPEFTLDPPPDSFIPDRVEEVMASRSHTLDFGLFEIAVLGKVEERCDQEALFFEELNVPVDHLLVPGLQPDGLAPVIRGPGFHGEQDIPV